MAHNILPLPSADRSHHYSGPGIIINKIKKARGGVLSDRQQRQETEMVTQNGGWSRPGCQRGRRLTGRRGGVAVAVAAPNKGNFSHQQNLQQRAQAIWHWQRVLNYK